MKVRRKNAATVRVCSEMQELTWMLGKYTCRRRRCPRRRCQQRHGKVVAELGVVVTKRGVVAERRVVGFARRAWCCRRKAIIRRRDWRCHPSVLLSLPSVRRVDLCCYIIHNDTLNSHNFSFSTARTHIMRNLSIMKLWSWVSTLNLVSSIYMR